MTPIPRPGMLATVRNRRGTVTSVAPFDGEDGRLHLVHLDYQDGGSPTTERLLWELEPSRTLLEPTALPDPYDTDPMPAADFDALLRVELDTGRTIRGGMFVAQVVGKSMEPRIPDGAHCLFAGPVALSRQGRTVLVRLRDKIDPETGERFTVKRYRSRKTEDENGWRHVEITLEPVNRDFEPIVIVADDEPEVGVVAEVIEVLGPGLA